MKTAHFLPLLALLAGVQPMARAEADNPNLLPGLFPREPFQYRAFAQYEGGSLGTDVSFEVPGDKRLVIETVSIRLETPHDQQATSVSVRTDVNGVTAWHEIPFSKSATFTTAFRTTINLYTGASPVRLYADPGSTVYVLTQRDVSTCPSDCGASSVFLSGYLVSAFSPSLAP
ncbi:hypothetical protein [Pseudomonas mangiferae]|uniref:Uncharacterized protein n=1 Tax=Pseudomonas mangiferae TaxID=2593654 RepID=A0A553GW36_9PSED|nr:hypothetical protein [Pseudomonas mangiferae]TRX73722.1 hypothetical protein FM069_16445 [Pseudomonas mangiferae]